MATKKKTTKKKPSGARARRGRKPKGGTALTASMSISATPGYKAYFERAALRVQSIQDDILERSGVRDATRFMSVRGELVTRAVLVRSIFAYGLKAWRQDFPDSPITKALGDLDRDLKAGRTGSADDGMAETKAEAKDMIESVLMADERGDEFVLRWGVGADND